MRLRIGGRVAPNPHQVGAVFQQFPIVVVQHQAVTQIVQAVRAAVPQQQYGLLARSRRNGFQYLFTLLPTVKQRHVVKAFIDLLQHQCAWIVRVYYYHVVVVEIHIWYTSRHCLSFKDARSYAALSRPGTGSVDAVV